MPTNLSTKAYDISTYLEVPVEDKEATYNGLEIILKSMSEVSDQIKKKHLLDGLIWVYTEGATGRYKYKCRYRTESVLQNTREVEIQHEHVYTRKFIKGKLLNGAIGDVEEFLKEHCFGCLVSKEEHARMGSDQNGWKKYHSNGIRVFDIVNKTWLNE